MVGGTEVAVVDASADADQDDTQVHGADIEADLLEAAERIEGEDVEDEGPPPSEGQAGGNADRVLLGDPRIQVLVRELAPVALAVKADGIGVNQDDARVAARLLEQRL